MRIDAESAEQSQRLEIFPYPNRTSACDSQKLSGMEHQRIDEGIERPRNPPQRWPSRKPPTAGKLGVDFDVAPVLNRYLHGEELSEIAASYGVHPKALNYHLLKDEIREQWRQAQVAVSLAEYLEAREVIRGASDALSLARAREIVRACQWDLERLESRIWGERVNVDVHVDIGQALQKISERLQAQSYPQLQAEKDVSGAGEEST